MSYFTIAGTAYLIREDQSRGDRIQFEHRRRAIDGSLLVDPVANKKSVQVEITGLEAENRFFTIAEADTLIATLLAGSVAVAGDLGTFTARARDIGWVDGQHYPGGPHSTPTLYRLVTATLEEV